MRHIRLGRILDLELRTHLKFLVTREGEESVFYAGVASRHAILASRLKLSDEQILGGGEMDVFEDSILSLTQDSQKYGGVPKDVLLLVVPDLLKLTACKEAKVNTTYVASLDNRWS